MYKKIIKRFLDFIISLMLMPVFGIVFLVVAPLIRLEDGGDVFYVADRRGLNGKIFKMYKFRSMKMNSPVIIAKDGSAYSASDDKRLTKIGKILRKTSIDELPQFLNVLNGDMSLVGPRPVMPNKKFSELTKKDRKRLSIRPGITGYSQAYYRNSISQEQKFENDLYYGENISLKLDIKIVLKTIESVLMRKNIY